MRVSPSPLLQQKKKTQTQTQQQQKTSKRPTRPTPNIGKSRRSAPPKRGFPERRAPAGRVAARRPLPGRALPGELRRYFSACLIHLFKCLADVLNPAVRALHERLHNGPDSVMKQEIITSAFSASIFQIFFILPPLPLPPLSYI